MGDKEYRKKCGDILNGHAHRFKEHAYALPKMVLAANRFASSAIQVCFIFPFRGNPDPNLSD